MILDLLKTRRSIRKFSGREVEQEKIDVILKSALLSPSSRSIRPWELVLVRDKGTLAKLSECRGRSSRFLSEADIGIIVAADPAKSDVWIEDASIASIIIQLSAHSQGLGSCWIQIRNRSRDDEKSAEGYVKEILGIPESYKVESMIAIGYPGEKKDPYDESDLLMDKVHIEKL